MRIPMPDNFDQLQPILTCTLCGGQISLQMADDIFDAATDVYKAQ